MPQIDLSLTVPAALAAFCVLAAAGVAYLVYRRTLPPVPPTLRLLLAGLRGAALGLILLLLFEPSLELITRTAEQPAAAVVIDNSRSMGIRDRAVDRRTVLASLLGDPALADLASSGSARFYLFGADLRPAGTAPPESLALDAAGTDIAAALRALAVERERGNIRAVLLLTDGVSTLGRTPLYDADALGLPVYAVGIGDSTEQRDVLISRVLTNSLVYAETDVPVDVTVKSSGYPGARVEITLAEGGREIRRVPLTLGPGTRDTTVRLSYVPAGDGVRKYTVGLSALAEELTAENNRSVFFARVLKSKLRILLIAGGPSHDVAVIRQTLSEDRNFEVHAFVQRRPSGFYGGPFRPSALDSADVVVLVGFPTSASPPGVVDALRSAAERSTPLMYIDGRGVDDRLLAPLAPLLPFTGQAAGGQEDLAGVAPAAAGRHHPVLALGTAGAAPLDRLPPLFRRQAAFRARPEALVLATARVATVTTADPVVLLRSVNRRRSMAILAHGIWRWRLMVQGNAETEGVLAALLGNSIRWLTAREEDLPVTARPVRDLTTQGEPVLFTGQVYDAAAAPVDNARLLVRARSGDLTVEAVLRPVGSGRYEGALEGLPAGDYTYSAEGTLDGTSLGSDRGRFSVGELDLEFRETRMDIGMLRQMAARTGGRTSTPEGFGTLVRELRAGAGFAQRESERRSTLDLWTLPLTLGVIVALLSLEWFLRKRSGML